MARFVSSTRRLTIFGRVGHPPEISAHCKSRLFQAGVWLLIGGISLGSLLFFMQNKVYYYGSDVYYYLSMADSLAQYGRLQDLTLSPPQPPLTPQNAVVILHYFLRPLVPAAETRLRVLVGLNYMALLLSLYPLLKIARIFGLSSFPVRAALVAVSICGWHMLRFQLNPINDGLFGSGSLWLIYWILTMEGKNWSLKELGKRHRWALMSGCFLAAALIHFRLNALILPLAGCFAALLLKRKNAVWIMLLLVGIMLVSLWLPYRFVELSRIQAESPNSWLDVLRSIPRQAWDFVNTSLPSALFRNMGTARNIVYAGFAIAILCSFRRGIREQEYRSLFLVLICLGTFLFLILYRATPYRMLLMVYPLLYLLLLREQAFRPLGYLFVCAVVAQSLLFYLDGMPKWNWIAFWTYVSQKAELEPSDYLMITKYPRQAYYFSGMSGLYENRYSWEDLRKRKNIYVAGPRAFLNAHKKEMRSLAARYHRAVQFVNLTPGYTDPPGHALLRVRVQKE